MGMPMRRLVIAAGLVGMLMPGRLMAQYQSPTFARWEARAAAGQEARWAARWADSLEVPRRDYRYEGLLVGGVAMGALAAWIGSRVTQSCPTEPGVECGPDRLGNAVALGLVGAALGGGLGYVIGRLSAKPSRAATRAAGMLLGAVVILGCSDGTGPAPGTFQAQLSGVLSLGLSGPSNAGVIYTEELPTAQFAIRMYAGQGDTVQAIALTCPGEGPPAPGRYLVSPSETDCRGNYSRFVSSLENGTIVLERVKASSGSLTISTSAEGETTGSFNFVGILILGSDSVGSVAASGSFNAEVYP
jgi:hypothetical protein